MKTPKEMGMVAVRGDSLNGKQILTVYNLIASIIPVIPMENIVNGFAMFAGRISAASDEKEFDVNLENLLQAIRTHRAQVQAEIVKKAS